MRDCTKPERRDIPCPIGCKLENRRCHRFSCKAELFEVRSGGILAHEA